jgi:predicted transcriptional regulator
MTSDVDSATDRVPDDVRALLSERIESYEQLEILLALESARGTERTSEELSATLRIGSALVEPALRSLESRGLIGRRSTTEHEPHYLYMPATSALDGAVRALARAYAEQPIPVIKLMSENAIQRVRTGAVRAFADAFILRKDKNDG